MVVALWVGEVGVVIVAKVVHIEVGFGAVVAGIQVEVVDAWIWEEWERGRVRNCCCVEGIGEVEESRKEASRRLAYWEPDQRLVAQFQ